MGAQSALILLPRFTTLVGPGDFVTAALDTSRYGSCQFEFWRGPLIGATRLRIYLEDSLDGVTWLPLSENAKGHDPGEQKSVVLQRVFTMKWFRVRVQVIASGGTRSIVSCWAEGLLRG